MKIEFELVQYQVDKLYDFSITNPQEIDRRCLDIQDFIENCGWNLDDFIRQMMGFDTFNENIN